MTKVDLQFGFERSSIDSVRSLLERTFRLVFEERYSDYLGGDYYLALDGAERFSIQWNRDMDELAEPDFPTTDVLLYIEGTERPLLFKSSLISDGAHVIREARYEVP